MLADISEEYSASIFREEEKASIEKYGMNIGSRTTGLGNLFFSSSYTYSSHSLSARLPTLLIPKGVSQEELVPCSACRDNRGKIVNFATKCMGSS
jgi:hypothetical protein